MKKLILCAALLISATSFAKNIECYQDEGGDLRYDLKYQDGYAAIIHTDYGDYADLTFYDSAEYYESTNTVSAGRYIVNFNKNTKNYSSLYKLVGNEKVLLTDTLDCGGEIQTEDINEWVVDNTNN